MGFIRRLIAGTRIDVGKLGIERKVRAGMPA
jgi:hypothetical protein